MRISVPDPINNLSFESFIVDSLLGDPQFGRSLHDLLLAHEIEQAAHSKAEILELSKPAYDKLVQVMTNPTNGYNPKLSLPLMPFFQAILAARE